MDKEASPTPPVSLTNKNGVWTTARSSKSGTASPVVRNKKRKFTAVGDVNNERTSWKRQKTLKIVVKNDNAWSEAQSKTYGRKIRGAVHNANSRAQRTHLESNELLESGLRLVAPTTMSEAQSKTYSRKIRGSVHKANSRAQRTHLESNELLESAHRLVAPTTMQVLEMEGPKDPLDVLSPQKSYISLSTKKSRRQENLSLTRVASAMSTSKLFDYTDQFKSSIGVSETKIRALTCSRNLFCKRLTLN